MSSPATLNQDYLVDHGRLSIGLGSETSTDGVDVVEFETVIVTVTELFGLTFWTVATVFGVPQADKLIEAIKARAAIRARTMARNHNGNCLSQIHSLERFSM